MATRDYVKRGRGGAKKKNTRQSRRQPSANNPFPVKWGIIALVLVGALGYGLYFLSTSPTPETPVNQPVSPTPPSQPAKPVTKPATKPTPKPTADIPPLPEEEWRYKDILENKTIEVDEKTQPSRPSRPYQMQCGAYRNAGPAEERKAMIAFQGLVSEIRVSQGEKGEWHRVILGPYDRKRDAERDRNVLRRAGIEPCAIWHWE
ncbi:SPOR domain-containing protein [Thaumasiovibrio subtropicus]|uniref:SPOR domain-containing protein n=1 Tax=Thaumasiovibrio subtropicus TaxID=1891207 RepID=UPI000B351AE5|nr:SPOR domain-containing protein [Thaumasiovibrio subtropicus]